MVLSLQRSMTPLPLNIIEWLHARGITDAVISVNGITWNGTQIVIPVKDASGTVLFNKYRRDPFGPTDTPKYRYEAGTTAQLFNAHKIKDRGSVIICEGEMDALRLESAGYVAVTSTGGAGTFKDEWLEMLAGKDLYVCYDNDEAGLNGAVKLLTKLPAKLILIPRAESVKDVTDYLKIGGNFPILLEQARAFPILSEPLPTFTGIGDREAHIKKYKHAIDEMVRQVRDCKNLRKPFYHLEAVIHMLLVAIENLEREIRRMRRANKPQSEDVEGKITEDDITRAKAVPIDELYGGKLHQQGKRAVGPCPFHNEKTGSFTIYLDQNKFYCYGCSAGVDAIDFVMKRDSVDFFTAIRTLLNKTP